MTFQIETSNTFQPQRISDGDGIDFWTLHSVHALHTMYNVLKMIEIDKKNYTYNQIKANISITILRAEKALSL